MNRLFIFASSILFFLGSQGLKAQSFSYKNYTVRDGLVQNQAMHFGEDSKGYLWVMTKGGISRFDGLSFKNFTVKDGLPTGMAIFMQEDSAGLLYFVTTNYITVFDGKKMKPHMFPKFGGRQLTSVSRMIIDSFNAIHILLTNEQSVFHATFSDSKFTVSKIEGLTYTGYLWSAIAESASNCFYIFPANGNKYSYDISSHKVSNSVLIPDSCFAPILINGNLGYLDRDNFMVEIQAGKKIRHFKLPASVTLSYGHVLFTRGDQAYLRDFLKSALVCINQSGDIFVDSSFQDGLGQLFLSRDKTIWIGSENGFYRLMSTAFLNFTSQSGVNPNIWSIVRDDKDQIWLGSLSGKLQIYDGIRFKTIEGFQSQIPGPHKNICYYMGAIRDSRGNLWFPGSGTGQNLLKWDGRKFTNFPDLLQGAFLFLWDEWEKNRLLCGGSRNICILEEYKKQRVIPVHPGNVSNSILSILKDKNGSYWLGGRQGISIWDGDTTLIALPQAKPAFSYGAVAMVSDKKKNIWIGNDRGLFLYDYATFKQISNYRWDGDISSLTLMQDGKLMIGAFEGLAIFDLPEYYKSRNENFLYYDQSNGFLGIECGQNAVCLDHRGRYWIPTNDRVMVFDPSQISAELRHVPVYLSGLQVLNDRMEWMSVDSIVDSDDTKLRHDQNNLRLNFHAIDFQCPERVKYTYFLEGYDKQWSSPSAERYSTYTNLAPGHYVFHVNVVDENGLVSGKESVIRIYIVPALWQRWWFRVLAFLVLVGLLTGLSTWLLTIRRRQKQKLLEDELIISELQLKTFRNQMEPHFTFNAINTIGSSIYGKEPEVAYTHLQKFSRLVRSLILSSDQVSRPLSEEIDFVRNYLDLENYRFGDRFKYDIWIDETVDIQQEVPKMIIHTYVENALKHGLHPKPGDGRLDITISHEGSDLKITIQDDGIGRAAAAGRQTDSTGKGLKIIREYCNYYEKRFGRSIRQTIDDISGPDAAAGTKVSIWINDHTGT